MAAHTTRKIHGDRGNSPVETVLLLAFIAVVTLLTINLIFGSGEATIDLDDPFQRVANEM